MRTTSSTEEFPFNSRTVAYIEVTESGEISQPSTAHEKREACFRAIRGETRLYAVWPGQFRSDLFTVDHPVQMALALGLDPAKALPESKEDPCSATDQFGGECVYRKGHSDEVNHRYAGGDEDARYEAAVEARRLEATQRREMQEHMEYRHHHFGGRKTLGALLKSHRTSHTEGWADHAVEDLGRR